jgi:hypothetical protein
MRMEGITVFSPIASFPKYCLRRDKDRRRFTTKYPDEARQIYLACIAVVRQPQENEP